MNNLYAQEFIKQSLSQGIPQEKIAALLERMEHISQRRTTKVAKSNEKFDIVNSLLKSAGMEKTASSIGFTQGILNEAFMNGANLPEAIQLTKTALDSAVQRIQFMQKVGAIANHPELSQWAEGFLESAKQAGLTQDESVSLMVDLVDKEKQAAGHSGGSPDGSDAMFKQPDNSPAPDNDPMAGAPPAGDTPPPGAGAGGGDAEAAQILQMLQSLPPEEQQQIMQQLLSVISGVGAGGPGGPAGAPPPPQAGPQGSPVSMGMPPQGQ